LPVDTTAAIDLPIGSQIVVDVSAVMANAGALQYWQRTGTELTPATSGDNVEVTSNASQGAIKGISTDYHGIVGITSKNTTNYGGVYGENTSTGSGVLGYSSAGVGVRGDAVTGIGVNGVSSSYFGLLGNSVSGYAIGGDVRPTSTNNIADVLYLSRRTSGTAANGIGAGIVFLCQNDVANTRAALRIAGRFTDVTNLHEYASYEVQVTSDGSLTRRLSLAGTGALTLDAYGDGTFTGTPT
jgi:hypothetical protein